LPASSDETDAAPSRPLRSGHSGAVGSDGVLLVDKPAGVTSHDVVAQVRRRLGRGVKVGHAGTLDPFATGLLLVLVGRATRVQRFLMALPKRYEVVARLGWTSTTGDPEGEVAPGRTPPEPLVLPTGRLRQRPPAYSAVKVGGRRAYQLARRGEAVELPERDVEVGRFDLLWRDVERAAFAIECSSGTYVRSLIADLGDAYCLELRRTAIGPFAVAGADPERLVALVDALGFLPERRLGEEEARRAAHGVAVAGEADGTVRLLDDAGLIALAEPRPDGTLKPIVGFRG
jgi:tRNA pseudouridine55 synthase